jgi:hypothetical protein
MLNRGRRRQYFAFSFFVVEWGKIKKKEKEWEKMEIQTTGV